MNSLSWLIYIADVLPSASNVVMMFSIIFLVYFVVIAPPKGVKMFTRGHDAPFIGIQDNARNILLCSIVITLTVLIPSKETFYLIAASEAGQSVVESQQGQEILDDLTLIINQELERMKNANN